MCNRIGVHPRPWGWRRGNPGGSPSTKKVVLSALARPVHMLTGNTVGKTEALHGSLTGGHLPVWCGKRRGPLKSCAPREAAMISAGGAGI